MAQEWTNFWINVSESRSSSAFEKSLESLKEFGDMTSSGGSSHDRDREKDPIRGDLDKVSAHTCRNVTACRLQKFHHLLKV
jgi:hypothetical protein